MDKQFNKLRGRIIEIYGTIGNFAEKTGKSRVTVFNKLTTKADFSREDICKWAKLLKISQDEIGAYFFEN